MECKNITCCNPVVRSDADRRSVYCSVRCRHADRNLDGRARITIALRMDDFHAAAKIAEIEGCTIDEWLWAAALQAIDAFGTDYT